MSNQKGGANMKYFEYPIDSVSLLSKKRKIRRELKEENIQRTDIRIAILGGSTTDEIKDQLELFLLNYGFDPSFYQSEYGKYWEDAVFENNDLNNFKPSIIIIHTNWRNIAEFPRMSSSKQEVDDLVSKEISRFTLMWESLRSKYKCPIIQNNFDRPNYRLLGNRDIWDYRGRSNFVFKLNEKIYDYANQHDSFYVNDLDYVISHFGLDNRKEALYWNMYKYAINIEAIPFLAFNLSNIIKSIYGKNKKLLALDLDNTLWGGVIGDDGVNGIAIGPEVPRGQVYSEFQHYCKELKDIGVVLAINSKNEYNNAILGLKHPDSILAVDDFVSIKANWDPKNLNLKVMADELSLGTDSFVFIDDNPAERDIVRKSFPTMGVPDTSEVEDFIRYLDSSGYFEVTVFSNEDFHKTEMYHAKAKAMQDIDTFSNYDDYLESLEMKAIISDFDKIYVQRISQLTNKSNQFNLTTLRCSEEDIQKIQDDEKYVCLAGRLIDKFADNGLITVVFAEQIDDCLHIREWLMSCRVLKRDMEKVMMNALFAVAKEKRINKIVGYYYSTPKNSMVSQFYASMGFDKILDKSNDSIWERSVQDYVPFETKILIC